MKTAIAVLQKHEAAVFTRAKHAARNQRGYSMVELLASVLVLSFLVAATGSLYMVYQRVALVTRNYSQAQTDLRTAFRSMLRTIRHGTGVVASASINGVTKTSDNSQIIVNIPQTTGSSNINVLYYKDTGGTLYYQRQGDTTGTSIISGVTAFTVHYYQTAATSITAGGGTTTTTQVDSTPAQATEVQISLTVTSGGASYTSKEAAQTTVQSYVALRNTSSALNTSPQ